MTKRPVKVHPSDRVDRELQDLADRYGVSRAYILLLAYKLSDRQQLIDVLQLELFSTDE